MAIDGYIMQLDYSAIKEQKVIDYICNPDKTDIQILISSYGCSYQTADIEFGFTLSKARDKEDNLGHHLIQSFAPGEVSYEEAHRIGKEVPAGE